MFEPADIKREEQTRAQEEAQARAVPKKERKKIAQTRLETEKRILEEERIYRQGTVSVRDLIAPAAMEVLPSFVKLSGKFVRTIFVITYPRYITVGWFAPIINLNLTVDIAMFFYPVRVEVILKQLKKKAGIIEAQLVADAEKGAPRDPIRETALERY